MRNLLVHNEFFFILPESACGLEDVVIEDGLFFFLAFETSIIMSTINILNLCLLNIF